MTSDGWHLQSLSPYFQFTLRDRTMDKKILLSELHMLLDDSPSFEDFGASSQPHFAWLGKAHALIVRWNPSEARRLGSAIDLLGFDLTRGTGISQIMAILHRAVADLELATPNTPEQVFGPGAVYDFYKAFKDLIEIATTSLFIIDPYLDDEIFDAYLSSLSRPTSIRLLTRKHVQSLKPAVDKFNAQTKRNVVIKKSDYLHDRVVFIDDRSCWVLGHSIKHAATKNPHLSCSSITRCRQTQEGILRKNLE